MGFPASALPATFAMLPDRVAETRARLGAPAVPLRLRLEVSLRGGGRRGVERLAAELRGDGQSITPAELLAAVQAEPPDPEVPGDTIPWAGRSEVPRA